MPQTLPLSRLIKASLSLTPTGAQAQSLSSLLVLGTSAIIDSVERFRTYASIDAVAADFGNSAPEYLAAAAWFSQSPQPTSVQIGRWFNSAGSGVLRGAPLSAAQQALANFTAVAAGGFTYSKNGAGPTNVTGINLSTATNLNQVASAITAALSGATMTWNSVLARFELSSTTTGPTSAVSFLTAPGSGTDISGLLGMTALSSGAYAAPGVSAESAVAAVTLFDQSYGQGWYAAVIPAGSNNDHLAVAAYVEAQSVARHIYGVTTQEAGALVAATTTDIASQLKALGYKRTAVQYSSASAYAVCSLLGRILTVDYAASGTAITAAFKQEPGVTPEYIGTLQADSLKAKNCNAYLAFNNSTNIVLGGTMADGTFIDVITGTDWLIATIQTALYNVLYTTTTKVPQTDAGMNLLVNAIEAVCSQGVENGLLAPGVWNSAGFGALKAGDYMAKGFYVYAPRVSTQNPADRAARKSVPIQVGVKLAGAVHEINLAVVVNQ